MGKEQQRPFFIIPHLVEIRQTLDLKSGFERLRIHPVDSKKFNTHHAQILKGPLGNRPDLLFRFLLAESNTKVFKSDLPMLPIQKVPYFPHASSKRERKILWQKIDEK